MNQACPPLRRLAAAAGLAMVLATGGCSDSSAPLTATQVAAKVNSEEISVHQVNDLLVRVAPPTTESLEKTRREVLDKLIEQQLAVQQAVEKKLDRTPETIMALESAKREILARAYFEQVLSILPKPTQNDARKFFREHPELFSERRIYDLQEVLLAPQGAPAAASDALRQAVEKAATLDDVVVWLKQQPDTKFTASERSIPAEQIPLEQLNRLHRMQDGQIGIFETPQGLAVIRIAASRAAPVDETEALPQIQNFLVNQARHEAITREVKRLRESASIEYQGEFAKSAQQGNKGDATDLSRTLEKGVADLK